MSNRRTQKYISVIVRLILILICLLYILIDDLYFSDSVVKHVVLEDNLETRDTKTRSSSSRNNIEESAEEWVADKYNIYKEDMNNYINSDIELWVCDKHIEKYSTIEDISALGFKCDRMNDTIYSFGEMYGNVIDIGDTLIIYSCTNTENKEVEIKDCYLTGISFDREALLKVSEEVIDFGDDLEKITGILNDFGLIYHKMSSSEITQDYDNVVYDNKITWKIVLNTAEEVDSTLMFNRYVLNGTEEEGLTDITYELNIINEGTLLDVYNKITT